MLRSPIPCLHLEMMLQNAFDFSVAAGVRNWLCRRVKQYVSPLARLLDFLFFLLSCIFIAFFCTFSVDLLSQGRLYVELVRNSNLVHNSLQSPSGNHNLFSGHAASSILAGII